MAKDLTFALRECHPGTETERDLGEGIAGIWAVACCDGGDGSDEAMPGGVPKAPEAEGADPERTLCALRFDATK